MSTKYVDNILQGFSSDKGWTRSVTNLLSIFSSIIRGSIQPEPTRMQFSLFVKKICVELIDLPPARIDLYSSTFSKLHHLSVKQINKVQTQPWTLNYHYISVVMSMTQYLVDVCMNKCSSAQTVQQFGYRIIDFPNIVIVDQDLLEIAKSPGSFKSVRLSAKEDKECPKAVEKTLILEGTTQVGNCEAYPEIYGDSHSHNIARSKYTIPIPISGKAKAFEMERVCTGTRTVTRGEPFPITLRGQRIGAPTNWNTESRPRQSMLSRSGAFRAPRRRIPVIRPLDRHFKARIQRKSRTSRLRRRHGLGTSSRLDHPIQWLAIISAYLAGFLMTVLTLHNLAALMDQAKFDFSPGH